MSRLLVLQWVLPGLVSLTLALLRGHAWLARRVAVAGALLVLVTSLFLAAQVSDGTILTHAFGDWRPPYGIVFVADRLAAVFVVAQALLLAATVLLLRPSAHGPRATARALPLLFLLSFALTNAYLTGDLFNLFVSFELVLMLSYLLQQIPGSPRARQITFAVVVGNLVASLFFFMGVGLLYSTLGSVNLAHISQAATRADPDLLRVALGMLLVAFGVKSALVPLLFWLPISYPLLSGPVAALFAGTMTKLGVYAFFRTVPLLVVDAGLAPLLVGLGAGSALVAIVAALGQTELRRLLGYVVISEVGFMIAGVGLVTEQGLSGALFFTAQAIVVSAALFYLADEIERKTGCADLRRMHERLHATPALLACFVAVALAVAGTPPLSGFFGKLGLFHAMVSSRAWLALALLVLSSLLTLAAMAHLYARVFLPDRPRTPAIANARWPLVGLVALSLAMALGAGAVSRFTDATAAQLLDPEDYRRAVARTPGRPAPTLIEVER